MSNPSLPSDAMIQHLPEDIQRQLLSILSQSDVAHLATSCQTFHSLARPLLHRTFRCVSCRHALFHPSLLDLQDVRTRRPGVGGNRIRRRDFVRLAGEGEELGGMKLDERRGAANFHVLRELAQTVCRSEAFPLQEELQRVRALRCGGCGVFVGFRHERDEGKCDFVHWDFVELVDAQGRRRSLGGDVLEEGGKWVSCGQEDCGQELFEKDDMLPWAHVMSSTRLTDMDPYLEWDHSWAGAATASQPAFFVKRLKDRSWVARNVRAERLRQGDMEVADVFCAKCDRHVGWMFVSELVEESHALLMNYDQVGRFGIIRNAVTPGDPRYAT